MKVKTPKTVNIKQDNNKPKKIKDVSQPPKNTDMLKSKDNSKHFNLFVTSKSTQNITDKTVCMKEAIKAAIKNTEGSRLASIGTLRFQFSSESDALAAMKVTKELEVSGVNVKVSMASESYDPTMRCLYVSRSANFEIIGEDVKKAFKAESAKPIMRFHKFSGLLMLKFNNPKLADEADKISFNYGGEVRQCRPCLKYRKPQKAKEIDSSEPIAKKQKLDNGASVEADSKMSKKEKKKAKQQKVEIEKKEESDEEDDDEDMQEEDDVDDEDDEGDDDDEDDDEDDDDEDDDEEEE